jgi:hypothetical protein
LDDAMLKGKTSNGIAFLYESVEFANSTMVMHEKRQD